MALTWFKGYVPTKKKKCLVPFKNSTNLNKYDEVKNLPEYAGILAEETVLIDVDDSEQADIMFDIVNDMKLKCRVYKTSRGMHFLFKNNGLFDRNKIGCKIACGVTADIKIGLKNSYSVLKYDGKERPILYDCEKYEPAPKFVIPVKTNADFVGMGKGDGRNQALFSYILTLQSSDFTNNEARECIEIINKYVLSEPLDDSELNTILREQAFKAVSFVKNKVFQYDKFANFLKNQNNIIKIHGQLHIYKDGIYSGEQRDIEKAMIKIIPNMVRAKRSETLAYLDVMIEDKSAGENYDNLIAFKNGVYNIETDTIEDFNPAYLITNKINYNYVPDAYHELTDRTLDKLSCNDKEMRLLLEELVGYCFYRRNELRKAFILTGEKKNGKSTFLAILKELLGDDNTVSLDLGNLGDRFSTASLFGKLANIGDDIDDEFIANTAVFKKIVSGDWVKGERKGQAEFFFKPYCKLLFSANTLPRMKDKTGAVLDRLIIIPFNAKFTPSDPDFDPYIKYKLLKHDALEYLIVLGIKGLKRVLKQQGFTIPKASVKSLEEYEETNNPIVTFFKEIKKVENETTNDIYTKYSEFCIVNGFNAMSKIEFSKQTKKYFGVDIVQRKVNGKVYKVFVKK